MLLAVNALMLLFAVALAAEAWRRHFYKALSPTRHLIAAVLLFVASVVLAIYFWNSPAYWQLDARHRLPCGDYGCPE